MNAMFVISILECINITTILLLLRHYFNLSFIFFHSKNEILLFAVFFGIVSYVINIFILYRKIDVITKKYKSESKLRSVLGFIGLLFYVVGSFYFIYIVGSLFPIG